MYSTDSTKYKKWTWKHPVMIHWILNPGLAFNEVILGQRIPKIMLIEKDESKSLPEKSWVPCPHCEKVHHAMKWSTKNNTAFKNWFGLYCDGCGGIIPCLTNLTTLLLLAITAPLWYWFRKPLKKRWLEKQPARYSELNYELTKNDLNGSKWVAAGLSYGFIMFILMTFGLPFFMGDEITLLNILIGIPIWTVGGLAFGYFMKWFLSASLAKSS